MFLGSFQFSIDGDFVVDAKAKQHRKINHYQRVIVTENEDVEIVGVWSRRSLNNQASDMFAGGVLDNNFGLFPLEFLLMACLSDAGLDSCSPCRQ